MRAGPLVPNLLSVFRLALAPYTGALILGGNDGRALVCFAAAAFSDVLDGFLARRFRWTSRTGAWVDPLADKLLMSIIYIALGLRGGLPWWLVGLVFGRDVLILSMVALALLRTSIRDFPPSRWGKLSTVLQALAALSALLWLAGAAPSQAARVAAWAAAAGTVFSGVHYFVLGIKRYRQWLSAGGGNSAAWQRGNPIDGGQRRV